MSKPPENKPLKPPNPPARRETGATVIAKIEQSSFSGPLPSPVILEEYDRIVPGAAERILKMAEAEAQFQHDITSRALNAEAKEVGRGQILGFLMGALALLTSALALWLGHPDTASVIGGTTVVGLVSVFVVGRILDRSQETEKPKSEHKK